MDLWVSNRLRAPTINLARMDAIQSKKIMFWIWAKVVLCISTESWRHREEERIDDFWLIELRIWWVSNRFMSSNNQPGKNDAIQSKWHILIYERSPSLHQHCQTLTRSWITELTLLCHRIADFRWVSNNSLNKSTYPEYVSQSKTTFGVVVEHFPFLQRPTEVSANDAKRMDVSLAYVVGGLVGFRKDCLLV
jgi:hypothetical protein